MVNASRPAHKSQRNSREEIDFCRATSLLLHRFNTEAVPGTTDGVNQLVGVIAIHLAPQVADVNIYDIASKS